MKIKKVLLFFTFILFIAPTYGQTLYAFNEQPKEKKYASEFDGSENYLKMDVHLYLGETLQLRCDAGTEKDNSNYLLGFTKDYRIKKDKYGYVYPEIYHPSENEMGTDYYKIASNNFVVLDVYRHQWANQPSRNGFYDNIYYLKLYNQTLKDTAYYEYVAEDDERYFPFIVYKHYNYLKKRHLNQIYQMNVPINDYVEVTDYETGNLVKIYRVMKTVSWRCIDIIMNDKDCKLSMVLKNASGYKITVPILTVKFQFLKN
jgi:hypothetical protein